MKIPVSLQLLALKGLDGGGPCAWHKGLVAGLDRHGDDRPCIARDHGDVEGLGGDDLRLLAVVGGGGQQGGARWQLRGLTRELGVAAQSLGQLTQLDGGRLQRAIGLHLWE